MTSIRSHTPLSHSENTLMSSAFPPRLLLCLIFAVSSASVGQVSVVGELSQDRLALPGTTYEGSIIVRNDTDVPQEAKVYQTDYTFHFSGTNTYGEPGLLPRSNANWISITPSFLTLPPRSSSVVSYTVAVPPDSFPTLAGTFWSMIMVEGIVPGSPESSTQPKEKQEMGLAQTIRYGIQIATTIAETGKYNVRFVNAELKRNESGDPVLVVDIENTGDLFMRPDVYVELFDAAGHSKGKFEAPTFRMYPGTSVREVMILSGVGAGTYKALVAVDNGTDDIFAVEYSIEL